MSSSGTTATTAFPVPVPAPAPAPASAPVTQRHLIDAIARLDEAFKPSPGPPTTTSSSSSRKRPRSTCSTTSTPALEALLSPPSTRPRPRLGPWTSSSSTAASAPPTTYNPTSLPALLTRLSTYRSTTFTPGKPSSLNALSCSLLGWSQSSTHPQRDLVLCSTCHQQLVLSPLDPSTGLAWSSDPGHRLRETYEHQLRHAHASDCPWRMRACSKSFYKVRSLSRTALFTDIRDKARQMRGLAEMRIDGPQVGQEQLSECIKALCHGQGEEIGKTGVLLALFGWEVPSSSDRAAEDRDQARPPAIIECRMCTRQVITSPYRANTDLPDSAAHPEPRSFDLVHQHQSFCPYISHNEDDSTTSDEARRVLTGWESRVEIITQNKFRRTHTSSTGPIKAGAFDWLQSSASRPNLIEGDDTVQIKMVVTTGQARELLNHVRTLLGPKKLPMSATMGV